MEPFFQANNLGFKYHLASKPTLKKLNFEIQKGEFIGIVGKNGSGKTTLCNLLRRIIPEHIPGKIKGELLLEGQEISSYSNLELCTKVGFVFQNPFLQISGIKNTVFEEIAFGLENLGTPREEIMPRVEEALEQFHISSLASKHPRQLSGGQCQRVALASVFVMNPDAIILDEPTSQLDPIGTEEVFEALAFLKQQKKTVLLVEHKIDLISEYADRVFVLQDRSILLQGRTEEILALPEITQYGVQMPNVARAARAVQEQLGIDLPKIPTTMDSAISILGGLLNEKH